jgi:hypothetical protein
MLKFNFTKCPCCKHSNPIPFRRKISMGLWSEEKCLYCQCRLKENSTIEIIMHLFVTILLPFGFLAGVKIFKLFFASEFGLSFGYFLIDDF